jgi:ubiquinone/menaquinone biosynthesis C-methylase UbiE
MDTVFSGIMKQRGSPGQGKVKYKDCSGGLNFENFTQIGVRGVGDPRNSYPQAMSWFKGKLYVGTSRDTLCLLRRPRKVPPPEMEFWPVQCPDPEVPELLRAQILSYDPAENRWDLVYRSPLVMFEGKEVPRDVGFRGMAVYRGCSDSEPCLYVGSVSPVGVCTILRTIDGINFEPVQNPLNGPTIRTLLPYKGKLYTTIIGKRDCHANESSQAELLETDDPFTGNWRVVSETSLGDPGNAALFEMAEFNGYLYVSTLNTAGGFQLWKTDAEGSPPYKWKKILTAGAYRGFLNSGGASLVVFNGCLYIGTGISGGGYDRVNKVGPAAAEVICVYPNDTWDLVVGAPRITPDGVKIPLSGMGPGFDNFMNGYMWRMCVHDGWLYVGTFNGAVLTKYRPRYSIKEPDKEKLAIFEKLLPTRNLENYFERYGGCHLWRTRDGKRFYPVTRNGFGSHFNFGIRQMTSTPFGLFVGTTNPFGPLVGVKRNGKWDYEVNPRGGMEIWLGSHQVRKQGETFLDLETREQQSSRALVKIRRLFENYLYYLLSEDYYGGTGFHHIGYWGNNAISARQACEDLLEKLLSLCPEIKGPVLDVSCGRGGTTHYLLKYFHAEELAGIDDSQWALDFCQEKIPDIRFIPMDPVKIEFPDESFSTIICLEGAPYFETRYKFLKDALRVLKPGGRLLLADILFSKESVVVNRGRYRTNYVKDLKSYKELFLRAGFEQNLQIVDLTEDCIQAYTKNLSEYMREQYLSKKISEGKFNAMMTFVSLMVLFAKHYLLVVAAKGD